MSKVQLYAFRLQPGQDLKKEIQRVVVEKQVKAGWINTCVGSLQTFHIRFANQPVPTTGSGHFEILGLSGTLSVHGSHIHIIISDSSGKTIGGHLTEGCLVYTTAEIVITACGDFEFTRANDGTTQWQELQVKNLK